MLAWNLALIAALLAAPDPFEARTLDGRAVAGSISELGAQQLVLETAGGKATFSLASLAALEHKAAKPSEPRIANLWVELIDHSGLAATTFTVKGSMAQVKLAGGAAVEVPARAIQWVRFGTPGGGDEKLNKQWSDILDVKAAGDLLVVRKDGALDYLEGVQGDVEADVCRFELDKEPVPVKRAKVEGILYFHPKAAETPEPIGQVTTFDTSRLALRDVKLAGDNVQLATPSGIQLEVPLAEIAQFDFSSGKIAYLSDLTVESATYVPYLGFKTALPSLAEFYQFRRDASFEQNPLKLDGKTYRKGLSLQSRTVLVYKLPGKFRAFHSVLGIDDSTREAGNVRVEIKGDGKTLWEGDVRGVDAPRELELEIAGVKRLEITADYGADADVGDRLDLCEARVTK